MSLLDLIAIAGKAPPPVGGHAAPLADRERHRFERVEIGKQRVDLEGAHQPALDSLIGIEARDVLVAEKNLSSIGLQRTGHDVDERGLAGAVRADQRIANAARQIYFDILRDDQGAEALVEPARR